MVLFGTYKLFMNSIESIVYYLYFGRNPNMSTVLTSCPVGANIYSQSKIDYLVFRTSEGYAEKFCPKSNIFVEEFVKIVS